MSWLVDMIWCQMNRVCRERNFHGNSSVNTRSCFSFFFSLSLLTSPFSPNVDEWISSWWWCFYDTRDGKTVCSASFFRSFFLLFYTECLSIYVDQFSLNFYQVTFFEKNDWFNIDIFVSNNASIDEWSSNWSRGK